MCTIINISLKCNFYKSPTSLFIAEGEVEFLDAIDLLGLSTSETEAAVKSKLGRMTRVACIGPAGEKLSYLAAIINMANRANGRTGLGAVMGSKRLKAVGTGRSLDVATSNFRGEVMAAVSFLSKQFKNETKACKWMAYNLEPHVNDRLVHVIPSNGHNAVKTLKPETIRRWYQTFKKSTKDSTKSRNPAIIDSYQRATRIWRSYMAGQDFEEIKPRLGEEAATFILNHIILTTRDIRDPEETYEGD